MVLFEETITSSSICCQFLVAVIPMAVFNIWLACIVLKNIRAVYNVRRSLASNSDPDNIFKSIRKKRHQKQLHLVQVFGALLCSNAVTLLPVITFFFLRILAVNVPLVIMSVAIILLDLQVILHPFVETVLIKEVREPYKKIALCCCIKLKSKFSSDDCLPSTNGRVCCSCCYGNGAESSQSPGCSGCGFLEICNTAVLMNYPQSSTTNSCKMKPVQA